MKIETLNTYIRFKSCESYDEAKSYASLLNGLGYNAVCYANTNSHTFDVRILKSTNGKITLEDLVINLYEQGYENVEIVTEY